MFSYKGLEQKLSERNIGRSDLTKLLGISSRTVAKIGKGEKLSRVVMEKLAAFFACAQEELCREISDNPILQTLREEKDAKISGGLYHELQVRMTYNSNHIEGSRLTEDQTRWIFETNTLNIGDGVPVDDVLETVHHFRAIDYVIDSADEILSEDIIKKLHYILKHDTKDSTLEWFAVGDYKKRPNVVGGRETAKPKDVPAQMKKLLDLVVPETLEESYYYSYWYNFVKKFSEKKGDLIFRKVWECDDYNNIEDLSNLREKFNEFKFDFYNVDFSSEVDTSKKYDIIYVSNIVDWLRNKKIDITLYAENLNRLLKEDGFAIGTNVVYSSYGGSDMDILGKYFECVPFKSIDERYCGKRSPGYCLIRK